MSAQTKKSEKQNHKDRLERWKQARKGPLAASESAQLLLWQIKKVLHCHFPGLCKQLNALPDPRIGVEYSIAELVMAAVVLFLLKCDSRNEFNSLSKDQLFIENYKKMFNMRPPGMDAVNSLFEAIDAVEFEHLRCRLICGLIAKRVFHRLRFFKGCLFCIAVDATGAYSWGAAPQESIRQYAIKREHKKESGGGRVNYSSQVLEAVLVCSSGMVIPLISEWIANDGEPYDKQDCELKAFKRLAARLKAYFPRLNVCVLADGLYSNVSMMNACREYGWKFITVFKDGNLPSVWEEVESLLPLAGAAKTHQKTACDSLRRIICNYKWLNGIEYQKHCIHWIECVVETVRRDTGEKSAQRFVFLTTLDISRQNVEQIVRAGRARWSIEDHFNTQKNRGGALHHKFNRNDFKAIKNWHNIRQIACMISELVEYTREIRQLLKDHAKMTLKALWKNINAFLIMSSAEQLTDEFDLWAIGRRQVRLE